MLSAFIILEVRRRNYRRCPIAGFIDFFPEEG